MGETKVFQRADGNSDSNLEAEYQRDLDWIHSTMRFGSHLGLDRIKKLVELLGHPENKTKFIHVAGTNGKGSVSAMVASVLKEAGYRTGLFISPYLEDFRERIMLNGKKIPVADLINMIRLVRPKVEEMVEQGMEHPTEFEINTAIALAYYAVQNADYVSFEVGLGGRFDATNVVTPIVSVITTISFDHMDRLGDTLGKIAFEKAGIIKPSVPVVTGVTEQEPLEVIVRKSQSEGSPLITVGKGPQNQVRWEEVSYSIDGQVIRVYGPDFDIGNLEIPLLGRHQQQNAAIAVTALLTAKDDNSQGHIYIDEQSIRVGLKRTVWPGRLEVIWRKPTIILDGAHNPDGARVLVDAVKDIPRKRLICVLGILKDKSYQEVVAQVAPMCDTIIVTKPDTPRALDVNVLSAEVHRYREHVIQEENREKALDTALDLAGDGDVVLVCGSLYLVGPLRTYIRKKFGISPFGGE